MRTGDHENRTGNYLLYAREFGGNNGGEQIQNALDTAANTVGLTTVVVNSTGPDDVSGSSGTVNHTELAQNAWELTTHLSIPSFTRVVFDSCYVFLADGADDNLVRNNDFQNGNNHIIINYDNAIFDGNNLNQTEFDRGTTDGLKNLGFRFYNCENLHLQGQAIVRNTNAWGGKLEACSNSSIEGITWDQNGQTGNMDGCKVMGPCVNVRIADFYGRTGDDMSSVNDADPQLMDGSGGDCRKVVFENIHRESSRANSGNAVRIWRSGAGVVKNIQANNIAHQGGEANAAITLGFTTASSSFTDFSNINVSNVSAEGATALRIDQPTHNLTASNISVENGDGVRINGEVHNSSFSNLTGTNPASILKVSNSLINSKISIGSVVTKSSIGAVVRLKEGGTVENCDISLGSFKLQKEDGSRVGRIIHVTNAGWYQNNVHGGHIESCYRAFVLEEDSTGTINNLTASSIPDVYYELGNVRTGPNTPPMSSDPGHQLRRWAWAGPSWDPDSDGNGELVVSDGTTWNEIVDMPNWT